MTDDGLQRRSLNNVVVATAIRLDVATAYAVMAAISRNRPYLDVLQGDSLTPRTDV